ncbi:unnamed protein product [Mytilus coruscus]|uniref:Uncharacterized protein n=1 Tax=Mytilus coruscus TaxID=42192 RepID=A0A6J8ESN7_MYTCO|nr:unnamed protein product [Mytilus coruscus]
MFSAAVFHLAADHPSVEKSSFSSDTLVIVLLIIIAVLVTGVVLYVRYMKQRFRKRLSVNPTRRNGNENDYYAEINEDNMKQTTSQENDNLDISTVETPVVENSGIVLVNEEPSSASSDHDRNASENLDDGYERPYNTLLANYQTKDNHVYLTIKKSS